MNEKLIILISEIILGSAVVAGLAVILIASWYDLRATAVKKHLQRISAKLNKTRQPWITIVVYTHNHSSLITECLDSIQRSRYANYRIVVVDHGSTDTTRRIVKEYQKLHKQVSLVFYDARRATSRDQAVRRGITKVPASQLTLTIDGSVLLSPDTLRNSASYFVNNDQLTSLHLRHYNEPAPSLTALTPQFIALTKNIIYKAMSVIRLLPKSPHRVMLYRPSMPHNKQSSLYMSTISYRQPLPSHSRYSVKRIALLTIVWLIIAAMMSYWFWTAASLRSNLLLTLSWIGVCVWLLAIVWSDDVIRITKKIELSVSIPFMYFVFYAQTVVSFLVGIWRLLRAIPYRTFVTAFQDELYSTRY